MPGMFQLVFKNLETMPVLMFTVYIIYKNTKNNCLDGPKSVKISGFQVRKSPLDKFPGVIFELGTRS